MHCIVTKQSLSKCSFDERVLVSFYYYFDRAVTLSESAWQIDKLGKEIAAVFFSKEHMTHWCKRAPRGQIFLLNLKANPPFLKVGLQ